MNPIDAYGLLSGGLVALGFLCLWTGWSDAGPTLLAGGVLSLALGCALIYRLDLLRPTVVHFEPHDRNTPAPVIRGGSFLRGER